MFAKLAAALLLAVTITACTFNPIPSDPRATELFRGAERTDKVAFSTPDQLADFEDDADTVYRLGEGDQINVNVWGRPELSGKSVIGPDGRITVPLAGTMRVSTMTREEAGATVTKALLPWYKTPTVTVGVDVYMSNRITVLGRVQNPGAINFDKPPTILEVLSRAGALPVIDKLATLTRCAIFRGRQKVIWVDLQHLLTRSDPSYNIRLKPNDLVYIPDSSDTSVYVMGAVLRPGAYRLTPDMSLLDALNQAGGPNEDAAPEKMAVYRPTKGGIAVTPLSAILTSDRKVNYALEEGDIVYVPRSGIAETGYVLRQLLPGLSFVSFGVTTSQTTTTTTK